jgi:hypothetical protein
MGLGARQAAELEEAKNQLKACDVPACRSEARKIRYDGPDRSRDAAAGGDATRMRALGGAAIIGQTEPKAPAEWRWH